MFLPSCFNAILIFKQDVFVKHRFPSMKKVHTRLKLQCSIYFDPALKCVYLKSTFDYCNIIKVLNVVLLLKVGQNNRQNRQKKMHSASLSFKLGNKNFQVILEHAVGQNGVKMLI